MKKSILIISISCFFLFGFTNQALSSYIIDLEEDDWKATFFKFDFNDDNDFDDIDPISNEDEDDNSAFAGQFNVNFLDSNNQRFYQTTGFCIDLTKSYNDGEADITDFSGQSWWNEVVWLLDTYWLDSNSSIQNAALQLAVWDTIYGNRFGMSTYGKDDTSLNNDGFTDFIDIREQFYTYQKNPGTVTDPGTRYQVLDFDEDHQDIIIKNPVPEPTTMLLFGIGLLGLGALSRKKRI